jgi:hypothetical protein
VLVQVINLEHEMGKDEFTPWSRIFLEKILVFIAGQVQFWMGVKLGL